MRWFDADKVTQLKVISISCETGLKNRRKAGYTEGIVSIIINTLLFVLKYYVGLISNSIAVIGDAFHTLSDSLTSMVLITSYRAASKPPDKEHPFGHGRVELVSGIIIGVLLAVIGYEVGRSSIEHILLREQYVFSTVLVVTLIISLVVKLVLSAWAFNLGRRVGSSPIVADAWHHASDVLITGLVTVALYLGQAYWFIDGVLGLVTSGVLLYVAYRVVEEATSEIIGRSPSDAELVRLKELVENTFKEVKGVHHVHFHRYGDHVEITLHINLPSDISLREAHEIATRIENVIRKELGYEATIHVEPSEETQDHVD